MRDHEKLCRATHFDYFARESSNVNFVQRRVDFVKNTEGRRPIFENCQHQRNRRLRRSGAGQAQTIPPALPWGLCDQIDARLENVVFIDKAHLTAAASKKLDKHPLEVLVDMDERVTESFTRASFD